MHEYINKTKNLTNLKNEISTFNTWSFFYTSCHRHNSVSFQKVLKFDIQSSSPTYCTSQSKTFKYTHQFEYIVVLCYFTICLTSCTVPSQIETEYKPSFSESVWYAVKLPNLYVIFSPIPCSNMPTPMWPLSAVLLCGLKDAVHSSPVSSVYLECRRLNDPIFSQRAGKRHSDEEKKKQPSFSSTPTTFRYTETSGRLAILTAHTGDGDDEKRSSKQGEGQRLGRGKAGMQGPQVCCLGKRWRWGWGEV